MSSGYLYLLKQSSKGIFKIGITTCEKMTRIAQLSRRWGEFDDNSLIAETNCNPIILEKMMHQEFLPHKANFNDKKDGYTEFFKTSCFNDAVQFIKSTRTVVNISAINKNDGVEPLAYNADMTLEGNYLFHAELGSMINVDGINCISLAPKNYHSFCMMEDMGKSYSEFRMPTNLLNNTPKWFINIGGHEVGLWTIKGSKYMKAWVSLPEFAHGKEKEIIRNTLVPA